MVSSLFGRGPHKPFCDGFEEKLDLGIKALEGAKKFIDGKKQALIAAIDALIPKVPSTLPQINETLNAMEDGIRGELPDFTNSDDVLAVFQACGLMKDVIDITAGVDSIISEVFDKVSNRLNGLYDAFQDAFNTIAEYPVALLIKTLNDFLAKIKIPDLIGDIDLNLECIDALCSRDISSKVDRMNSLLVSLGLNDDGSFDANALMIERGLPGDSREKVLILVDKLDSGVDSLTGALDKGKSVISGAIDVAKGLAHTPLRL